MKERDPKNKTHPLAVLGTQHTDLILKNIDEVIYYVTLDKGKKEIVFLSDKIVDILGIPKKKYLSLGKKILDYCFKDDIPEILSQSAAILRKKVKGTFRYRFFNPKRKGYIWIEETIYPQIDKKKKLVGYFGVSRNIENEKRYEQQIIESEKKFRLLAENSSDIIFHFQFKPEPGYTYVSPSVKRILGYAPEEFYKDELIGYKIIHPDDRDLLLDSQQHVIKKRQVKKTFAKLAARYLTKKGEIVWLENRYSPIYSGKQIVALHCVSRDITEQKIKEQELDNSKMQLSTILSNLPGMAYRCLNDSKWTMKFISSGSIEVTGYKPEEIINNKKRSFSSLVHPDDRRVGRKEIKDALRKRTSFEIEYRIVDKNGKVKWIWEKGSGVYNKNKLLYIEGFINDISERKNAEVELNQRWLNYRNLVDAMPVGVFIHVNGKIQFGNKMAFDIAEIGKRDNLDEFSLIDFLDEKDHSLAVERIRRAMSGEDTPYIEYNITTRKGTHKVVRTKSSPIMYNATRAVQIVIQDITTEKKLEEIRIQSLITEQNNKELQKEVAKRVASEQKLNAIFQSTSHLIWTINKDLEVVSYNKQYYDSAKNLCGVTLKPGTKTTEFRNVFDAESYEELRAAHRSAFEGKDARIEIPLHAVDGKTYYREMHFHPIKINGHINEIAAVAQDTTERRNYEKQIIEQSSKLEAVFNSGNQSIWTVNKQLRLTSHNRRYLTAVQASTGKLPKVGDAVLEPVKNTPYYDFWNRKYLDALDGNSQEFETVFKMPDGTEKSSLVFLNPIFDHQKGIVSEIAAVAQDITERSNYQKQIIEQSSKLKAIFDSGNQNIWTVNKDLLLTSFNKNFADSMAFTGKVPALNSSVLEPVKNTPYGDHWKVQYSRAFTGETVEFETSRNVEGKTYYAQVYLHPVYDQKGQVTEVAGISQNITDRKNYEKQIIEQSSKLKAIFDSGNQHIWTVNRDFLLTSFNKNYAEAYAKNTGREPKINASVLESVKNTPFYSFWKEKYDTALNGSSVEFETEWPLPDGKSLHGHVYMHPVYNQDKEVVEVASISQNITDRKNYEKQIIEQSARLRAIFKSGSQLMWTVDKKLRLTSFNKNYADAIYELYGTYPELNTDINRLQQKLRSGEYSEFWSGKYEEVLSGKSVEFDTERTTLNGKKIYRHIFLHPILNEKNEVVEVSAVGYDITAQKKAQEEILSKQSQLAAIINTTDDIIFSIDQELRLVEFNEVLSKIVKERNGIDLDPGMPVVEILPAARRDELIAVYKQVLKGESITAIEVFQVGSEERVYEAHYNPIKTANKITGIAVFSRDITEQKRSEEEILDKQSRLSAIINNTNDIILSIDKNYNLVEFNGVLFNMVKASMGKILKPGMSVFETMAKEYHDGMREIYKRVFNGESVSSVGQFGNGSNKMFLETHYNPIKTGDKITGIAIFSSDISAQKKSEEETLKSLKEKEVLLKEVHHRVKNNLQVISSILNLQTAYLKDRGTINLLKECQNRIKTMAFIHESLYQNKDFSQINFSEYIITLVKNLFYSYEANQQKIRTNFAVDTIFLNLDLSIPCGLIVNELVSNALKYAFDDGREGTVFITLKKEKGKIKMVVADNGKGMPDHINFRNTETLGLQLVTTLTEQINGTISMNKNKGTTFEIIF